MSAEMESSYAGMGSSGAEFSAPASSGPATATMESTPEAQSGPIVDTSEPNTSSHNSSGSLFNNQDFVEYTTHSNEFFSEDTRHSFNSNEFSTIFSNTTTENDTSSRQQTDAVNTLFPDTEPVTASDKFSKDKHNSISSFNSPEFTTIFSNPDIQQSKQSSPDNKSEAFTQTEPYTVDMQSFSEDRSEPFNAREFDTVWHAESTPSHEQESSQNVEQTTNVEESNIESAKPTTESIQFDQDKTDVETTDLSEQHLFDPEIQTGGIDTDKTEIDSEESTHPELERAVHPGEKDDKGETTDNLNETATDKVIGEKQTMTSVVETALREDPEVAKALQTFDKADRKQELERPITYEGPKAQLTTQTIELMQVYVEKQTQLETHSAPQVVEYPFDDSHVQSQPSVEVSTTPKVGTITDTETETLTIADIPELEAEAVISTTELAGRIYKLKTETGTNPETALKEVQESLANVLEKHQLKEYALVVMKEQLKLQEEDEVEPEVEQEKEELEQVPPIVFNRDELTDAVRENLTMQAALEVYDETGEIDGQTVASLLPNPDAQPKVVKSRLVEDDDNHQDGSYQEFIDDLKETHATTLHDMQAKVDYIIYQKPAVDIPDEELRNPVEDEDVDRVLNELVYMPKAA